MTGLSGGANLLAPALSAYGLVKDATNPDLTTLERLTLVRGRVARMQEIERELERTATSDSRGKD